VPLLGPAATIRRGVGVAMRRQESPRRASGASVSTAGTPSRYTVQALQDQRGGEVAVAEHEPSGLERRADLVLKMLVAVGSY
jgi:hypothetical protein